MDNMRYYQIARSVPNEAKKSFSNGSFSGTDINPMWRIKMLTEMFGPCGIGWYYEVTSERAEQHNDMTMAIVDLNLYIKVDGEWSKPIFGTGGNTLVKTTKQGLKSSDEGYKMALTDALSVACKALGIGADVYFEKDTTKYTQYETKQESAEDKTVEIPKKNAFNARVAISMWSANNGLNAKEFNDLKKALEAGAVVPAVGYDDMSVDQFDALCKAIQQNYPDQLRKQA